MNLALSFWLMRRTSGCAAGNAINAINAEAAIAFVESAMDSPA